MRVEGLGAGMFSFERLVVWQKAIEYADFVYKITKDFPADERFGLTSQLRRSAVSISANIAEGSSRSSRADMSRFIEIAYGSLLESVTNFGSSAYLVGKNGVISAVITRENRLF